MASAAGKQRFHELLSAREWSRAGQAEWGVLRRELADVSGTTLRRWLREEGIPIDQPYAGVNVKSLAELEESLTQMAHVYLGNSELRRASRAAVIQAKDRARFAANNLRAAPEKRALKSEMVEWMMVWLGDPAMFATWARLRRASRPESSLT